MNWKAFLAMLMREQRVARRNLTALSLQTMLQPLLFVFIFGQLMIRSGLMAPSFRGMMLPGIMIMTMFSSGIQGVSMPLVTEFQHTREIEDRLLAPIDIHWVAITKIVWGMMLALAAGVMVLPAAWLLLGGNMGISFHHMGQFAVILLLTALLSAACGMLIGCTVHYLHIGLLFSLVVAPMMTFGCTYYPWSALSVFPLLQKAVLINPLVYASEGLRGTLAPEFPHLSFVVTIGTLILINAMLIPAGLVQFHRKALA
jgi:ABC-2 type transport system permease protein